MARPREFDIDVALDGAMNVYWTRGYERATLPDLLRGMDLTRGSLYKAFGDKKTLFLLALEKYSEEAVASAIAILSDETTPDGQDRIETLFNSVLETVRRGDRRGCLLCSSAAGPAEYDPDIAEMVHMYLEYMRHGFELALSHSQTHADLDTQTRQKLAHLLITHYTGLRVLSRAHANIESLALSVASLPIVLDLS